MRRDVQLFLGKKKLNQPSIGDNLVSNPLISDSTGYSFVNHSNVDGGKAKLTSINGSEAVLSQTISGLEANKKYQLRIEGLEYGPEKLVVNRMFNSEAFDSSTWTKSSVNVSANSTSSPIGTNTADKVTRTSTSSNFLGSTINKDAIKEAYTSSVYVKKGSGDYFAMRVQGSYPSMVDLRFQFSTESIVLYRSNSNFTTISSSVEKLSDGWFRVSATYETDASTNMINTLTPRSNTGNVDSSNSSSTSFCYVWGYQAEAGSETSTYVANTSSNEASYSYVNQTQQSVSNYLTYSNDLSNAAWSKARITCTDGQVSYFGDLNGTKIQGQNSLASNYTLNNAILTNKTSDYVISYYAKRGDSNYISTRFYEFRDSGNKYIEMTVSLNTGAVTSSVGTSTINFTDVEYMSDGWYKVSVGISTLLSNSIQVLFSSKYDNVNWVTGDTTAGLPITYISNIQIEENLAQGQYISTNGTPISLGKPDNVLNIYDASSEDGGLVYSKVLEAGTTSILHDFITNQNTGDLRVAIEDQNSTFEVKINSIYLSERIDAYYSTQTHSVDMFDFEDLNIVDKIKDVRDISKVFTEYSQKFTVPASASNNELFDHFYNEDVVSGFDHRVKHDAVIRVGGADYKHGQLTLLSSTIKNGIPHSYSVVFYGNTVKLNDLLGDDQLSDLTGTILDKLNIEYNSGNVFDLMTNGMFFDENNDLVVGTDNGVYADTPDLFVPFISCDSHYFYDAVDQPQVKDRVSSRNVKFGSGQSTRGIYYKDLKLAVKIKYIIQAIQEKYGVTFSNDFFNESIKEYSELSMLLHREKGGISSQLERTSDSFTLSELAVNPTVVTYSNTDWRGVARYGGSDIGWDRDYLDFVYASSFSQTPERGYYSHKIEFDVEVTGSGEYSIDVIDTSEYGPENTGFSWSGTGNKSVELIFRSGENNEGQAGDHVANYFYKPRVTVSTEAGISEYKVLNFKLTRVRRQLSGRYSSPVSSWDEMDSGKNYKYNSSNFNTLSDGVQLTNQLPNMKVIDFLTSLFKTFNLTAYSVPETDISEFAGQIRVRPLDAYYLSGNELDISHYVDTAKRNVNRNKLFSEVNFEFSKISTLAAVKAYERTGDTFGNERMNNLNASLQSPLAFDGGKYSVKTKFEKVMYERMNDQSDETTILPIQWGWMASKDENPTVGNPLLFYPIYQGVSGGVDEQGDTVYLDYDTSIYDKNKNVVTQNHAQFDSYIRPSNSLQFNGNSLHFGSEYDEWYVWEGSGSNENSLFNNYYANYLLSIYDKQSRLINIDTHLPVEVVMKLKLNDVVIINKKRFRINSLDLNLTTGAAKMELMNDLVYGLLSVDTVQIEVKYLNSTVTRLDVTDNSSNISSSYKVYSDGVFVKEFTGPYGIVYDSELASGSNNVTVRKCVQYDANTNQESYDSNTIIITA